MKSCWLEEDLAGWLAGREVAAEKKRILLRRRAVTGREDYFIMRDVVAPKKVCI